MAIDSGISLLVVFHSVVGSRHALDAAPMRQPLQVPVPSSLPHYQMLLCCPILSHLLSFRNFLHPAFKSFSFETQHSSISLHTSNLPWLWSWSWIRQDQRCGLEESVLHTFDSLGCWTSEGEIPSWVPPNQRLLERSQGEGKKAKGVLERFKTRLHKKHSASRAYLILYQKVMFVKFLQNKHAIVSF